MNAELEEACGCKILSRDDAIVMDLQARSAEPVAAYGAGEPLDFELDADNEQRRIDKGTQPSSCRSLLSDSARNFAR